MAHFEDLVAAGLLDVAFFITYLGNEPSGFCCQRRADAGAGRWYRTMVPAPEMFAAQFRVNQTSMRVLRALGFEEEYRWVQAFRG